MLVAWEPTVGLEDWNFHPSPPPLHTPCEGEERDWRQSLITGGQSCLMNGGNEDSINPKKDRGVWRASGLVNTEKFAESSVFREGMAALCPFSIPCPKHLFRLAVPEIDPFTITAVI